MSASSGKLTAWNPVANGTVQAMTLTTDGAKVIAGGVFSKLGNKTALGMGAISAQTGSVLTWKITSVVKDDAMVRTLQS